MLNYTKTHLNYRAMSEIQVLNAIVVTVGASKLKICIAAPGIDPAGGCYCCAVKGPRSNITN